MAVIRKNNGYLTGIVLSTKLHPSPFRTALGSLFHPPFDLRFPLSSPFEMGERWENDGRTED